MKKLTYRLMMAAVLMTTIFGCQSIPTAESTDKVAFTMGASTAIVVKMMKLDTNEVANVTAVLNTLKNYIPKDDEKISELWGPVATQAVDQMIANKELSESKAKLVKKAVDAIISGIDRLFEKNEEIAQYGDLVVVAINSFTDGYYAVMDYAKSSAAHHVDMCEVEVLCTRNRVMFDRSVIK